MASERQKNNLLIAASEDIRPSSYSDYKAYLAALYKQTKTLRNSDYSWQKFADDLGFGATTALHQVTRGYRTLTEKAAERIIKRLAIVGIERRYLLALVRHQNARSPAVRQAAFEELLDLKERILPEEIDKDTLSFFSEWYHPVIRELCGAGQVNDPAAIAERIMPHLRVEQVRESLALLERLGLIVLDHETGLWQQTQARISTGHRVKSLALISYHLAMIERGREALQSVPGERRDVSAMTLRIDEKAFGRLRSMIHTFQNSIMDEADKHAGEQIFQINLQFFPFTEQTKKKSE